MQDESTGYDTTNARAILAATAAELSSQSAYDGAVKEHPNLMAALLLLDDVHGVRVNRVEGPQGDGSLRDGASFRCASKTEVHLQFMGHPGKPYSIVKLPAPNPKKDLKPMPIIFDLELGKFRGTERDLEIAVTPGERRPWRSAVDVIVAAVCEEWRS